MPAKRSEPLQIEITTSTILKVLGIVAAIVFLYAIRRVAVITIFAFILASSLRPLIGKLSALKIPRAVAVAIVYIVLTIILLGIISAISVPLVKQSLNLFSNFSTILTTVINFFNELGSKIGFGSEIIDATIVRENFNQYISHLSDNMGSFLSTGISGISSVFGGIFSIVSFYVISIYMTIDYENVPGIVLSRIPNENTRQNVKKLFVDIEKKLGSWLGGQVLLCLTIGVMTWIFLTILRIPYALPLALVAGVLEILPGIGPVISTIPALFIALASGNILQIIGVPIAYILIQQVENNFLVPKIMSNAIGLSPLIVMIGLLIGGELYGPAGVLLAVPVLGVLQLAWDFFMRTVKPATAG